MIQTDCHLWIDADDTLWENNKFFEEVFARFVDLVNHPEMNAQEIRDSLDEIEHVNNRIHGYGAANFIRNLRQCMAKLVRRELTDADMRELSNWEQELTHHPLQLLAGVEETLAYLSERHELLLCTKGNPEEQQAKLARSGLTSHFDHIHVVKEKDKETYLALAALRRVATERTWMIGNSPKSDINPALAAGLRAIYIPHPRTWHLEHEEVPRNHERLLILERFNQLTDLF
jgi:putative hydrolase of the HAD superfamily